VDDKVHGLTFRHRIAIDAADIDAMAHVNNAVYLRWVQEAVVAFWQLKATREVQQQVLWVAHSHEIQYHLPLRISDHVEAVVTATGVRGSRASFTTLFNRGGDVAARVRSVWVCLDVRTQRPRRIAENVAAAFLPRMKWKKVAVGPDCHP
jgi:acyl-CoA thioester hydrolase